MLFRLLAAPLLMGIIGMSSALLLGGVEDTPILQPASHQWIIFSPDAASFDPEDKEDKEDKEDNSNYGCDCNDEDLVET